MNALREFFVELLLGKFLVKFDEQALLFVYHKLYRKPTIIH